MLTQTHALIAVALFAGNGPHARVASALAGALLPDADLWAMILTEAALGSSGCEIFHYRFFEPRWQALQSVMNSAPVWLAVLAAGWHFERPLLRIAAAASVRGFPAASRRCAGAFLAVERLALPLTGLLLGPGALRPTGRRRRTAARAGAAAVAAAARPHARGGRVAGRRIPCLCRTAGRHLRAGRPGACPRPRILRRAAQSPRTVAYGFPRYPWISPRQC